MTPHAFVAMAFGTKPGADGQPIHFNRVFDELLAPALRDAGFTVVRADQEQRAGDIRTDMFQELLAADLVLADLTIDNPNVWYELGVRHALRLRGVVLVQGPRATQPFDTYTDRKLNYSLNPFSSVTQSPRRSARGWVWARRPVFAGRCIAPERSSARVWSTAAR